MGVGRVVKMGRRPLPNLMTQKHQQEVKLKGMKRKMKNQQQEHQQMKREEQQMQREERQMNQKMKSHFHPPVEQGQSLQLMHPLVSFLPL